MRRLELNIHALCSKSIAAMIPLKGETRLIYSSYSPEFVWVTRPLVGSEFAPEQVALSSRDPSNLECT